MVPLESAAAIFADAIVPNEDSLPIDDAELAYTTWLDRTAPFVKAYAPKRWRGVACHADEDYSSVPIPTSGGSTRAQDRRFLHDVKNDPTDKRLDISDVTDETLLTAGHLVCPALEGIRRPTFTRDLAPISEEQLAPLLSDAHNTTAPRDNGPFVLALGVAGAAVENFCPDKVSALND